MFKLQSHYSVHFWTDTLEKAMNFFIHTSYQLNSTITRMALGLNNP